MITVALTTLTLLAPPPSGERLRFDADWRFYRVPQASAPSARGPFEWELKPAQISNLDAATLPVDLNEGDWKPVQLGEDVFNGLRSTRYVWYRTNLGKGAQGGTKTLDFESVDDNAVVFLNGKRLYKQIGYGIPFRVPVAEVWRPEGPNTLVVLVENTGGVGGINGTVDYLGEGTRATPAEMARSFDDSKWRTVHLPHDYVVEGTFDPNGDTGHGSLPKPVGYYRKTFVPPASMKGKSVWVDFDGVYRDSDVYLNGELLGHQSSGYMGFRYDLSKRLEYGRPNVLAVKVDPRQNEGWWYEGGGIYRHVWLNAAPAVHVEPDGVFVKPVVEGKDATVSVSTTIRNDLPQSAQALVTTEVISPSGRAFPGKTDSITIPAGGVADVSAATTVPNAQLWDLGKPNLYRVRTTVVRRAAGGSETADGQTTSFGIRTVAWDKDRGFLLNGRVVKLKGTCNHLDHAGVGIAVPDGLQEWRIRKMLEMGSNAWRTSHNPTSPEFMDMCDRLGMLVLDETRHFGDTYLPKSPPGTTADNLADLKAQVRRDRNHPCVIGWSVYNEETLQGSPEGGELFRKIRETVNRLDGTRIVTGATNFGYEQGIVDVTDLFGFNYNIGQYDRVRAKHPNTAFFGSETASTVSTRGEYANDRVKGYVSAYDKNYPAWAATAENAWKSIADRPWMAGAFVWTGFDYKGEPTPYGWPCVNSHFGIVDIAGFPKDNFFYYQTVWGDKPLVHLLPHWNWVGKEGQPIEVWAHSNADAVELFLNGKSLGRKEVPHLGHVEWSVPYAPGTLEARGFKGGKLVAADRVETTGAPVALRLSTDRRKLLADGEDVSIAQVEVVDAKGRVVPIAANEVKFAVEGAGTIGGVGNGDPSDHDPDKADHRKAFHGVCMALVQSSGKTGTVTLRVTSPGLKGAILTFDAAGGIVSH